MQVTCMAERGLGISLDESCIVKLKMITWTSLRNFVFLKIHVYPFLIFQIYPHIHKYYIYNVHVNIKSQGSARGVYSSII